MFKVLVRNFKTLPNLIKESPKATMSPIGSPRLFSSQNHEFDEDDDDYTVFINPDFIEFVEKLCEHPATWELFPLDGNNNQIINYSQSKDADPDEPFILTPAQERHANLILSQVPNLSKLRFELSPHKLTEDRFW